MITVTAVIEILYLAAISIDLFSNHFRIYGHRDAILIWGLISKLIHLCVALMLVVVGRLAKGVSNTNVKHVWIVELGLDLSVIHVLHHHCLCKRVFLILMLMY